MLLLLRNGARLEVEADAVPDDAHIIDRGLTLAGDFFVDLDSDEFTSGEPLTPLLRTIAVPL